MKTAKNAVVAIVAGVWLAGGAAQALESAPFRVDARAGYGGRVGTGVEQVGEVDGSAIRAWDTTAQADGWTMLESGNSVAEVCVLNGPEVVGGRLLADASWGPDRVHVVRDDVVVPEGVTLTLERGAVVKFTEGAAFRV